MQSTCYRTFRIWILASIFKLVVTNIEITKTVATFWFDTISRVVVFLIIVIVNDLRDILFRALTIALFLILALANSDLSDIISCYRETTIPSFLFLSTSFFLILFFFSSFI